MRSYLYVPGDSPRLLDRALDRGADALIVDLEDAVPPAGKDAARANVAAWLADVPATATVWVRINPGAAGLVDARAVVGPTLSGLCVAKTESVTQLDALDAVLSTAEDSAGLRPRSVPVAPLLESGAAVLDAPAIARGPRVARLQLGEADLRADLGVVVSPDERELLVARSLVVLASAAAGIAPPVAPVSTDFRDLAALRESTLALKRLGFRGRACIHPAQIEVVNELFTPTPAEHAAATDILVRFEAAQASGSGVCVDADGRLIDEAVVRAARRLLHP